MNRLFHISPLSIDMKIGSELNAHIECFPEDSWIMVTDRDTMLLGDNYAKIIHEAIEDNPDAALMTCWTNRLKNKSFCFNHEISNEESVVKHYFIAKNVEKMSIKYIDIQDKVIAGMMWLFPRKTWEANRFDDGNVLEVGGQSFDMRWTKKIKGKRIMINRLYAFHYYRMHKQISNFSHLKHNL